MLATPTASGKSLAYNVPCLHAIATDAAARAIYIFPTKALAQDQLRALRALCNAGAPSMGQVPSSWCHPYAAWGAMVQGFAPGLLYALRRGAAAVWTPVAAWAVLLSAYTAVGLLPSP